MELIEIEEGFWNIRGSFKVGGVVEIGTQASLVRLSDGDFVILDTCLLSPDVISKVDQLTEGGKRIKAILNLHPFHTVYVESMHERFPDAALYGTSRHLAKLPALPWQSLCTEDPKLHNMFDEDFRFSVPKGVDFISSNENVHFSSVLVFHLASKTIHVDDTLVFSELPDVMGLVGYKNVLSFHPTLLMALQKRHGAAEEFEVWARELADQWCEAENLVAAHTAPLIGKESSDPSIRDRMISALNRVKWMLAGHKLRVKSKAVLLGKR